MVVGAPPPAQLSQKQAAANKKLAFAAPLPSSRGIDPANTVVVKAPAVEDEAQGRPDKAAYDLLQASYKQQLDALKIKSDAAKAKINAVSGKGPNNERKIELRAILDSLRGEQSKIKGGRSKTIEQVKAAQDAVSKKIQALQALKGKSNFKSPAEVDNQIKSIERQVEGGMMKLVDEKKALNEISTLRKTKKNFEQFAVLQEAIDADKAKIDAIRAGLDDPEANAISTKFSTAKAELDGLNKAHDEASKGRDGLIAERAVILAELDAVYKLKSESMTANREANDKYYQKLNDERNKRSERMRLERSANDDAKRADQNERLLEEAQAPAFEREIEDTNTLINFFQKRAGISGTSTPSSSSGLNGAALGNKLDLRIVDSALPAGVTVVKKKGQEDEEMFGGGGGKKGKKGPRKVEEGAVKKDETLNLPFGTLSALLTMGIESPILFSQIQKTIEALEAKKAYFVANQSRVTKEKIAVVEKKIAKLAEKVNGSSTPADDVEEVAPSTADAPSEEKKGVEVVAVEA